MGRNGCFQSSRNFTKEPEANHHMLTKHSIDVCEGCGDRTVVKAVSVAHPISRLTIQFLCDECAETACTDESAQQEMASFTRSKFLEFVENEKAKAPPRR